MKAYKGFTLIELMIAVAIVAILAAIALPSYQNYVQKSARGNAQANLIAAASAMERLKAQNFTYANATIGTVATNTLSSLSPTDAIAGNQKYDITLWPVDSAGVVGASAVTTFPAGNPGYVITAASTALFDSSRTEVLKINHKGEKCYKRVAANANDCTFGTDPTWP